MEHCGTGGKTSAAAEKSTALVHEHLEKTRMMTLVKRVHKVSNNSIDAQLLQERKPTVQPNRKDEYGPCLILEEMSDATNGDATP